MAKKKAATKKAIGIENVKSFFRMNKDMSTAVYAFAGELAQEKKAEISSSQILHSCMRYLVTYARQNDIDIVAIANRVTVIENRDYAGTSKQRLKEMKEMIAFEDALNVETKKAIRTGMKTKTTRKEFIKKRNVLRKNSTKKKSSKSKK
jgi:hypothetical protein